MIRKHIIKLSVVLLGLQIAMSGCDTTEQQQTDFLQQGRQLIDGGQYKKAQMALEQALHIDPESIEGRFQLAESLNRQGKLEKAFKEYKAVFENHETHVLARVRAGQILLLNGQVQEAVRLSAQAMQLAPDDTEVLVFRAAVSTAANDSDGAIVLLEKALQREPDSISAALMLATVYSKTGKPDKALQLLRQTAGKHDKNESIRLMLADLLAKAGLLPQAEAELLDLVDINPANVQHHQRLASFYLAQRRYGDAEQALRTGIDGIDDSDSLRTALIDLLLARDNIDVAIAELLPMTAQLPDSAALQFKLADLYARKGDDANVETTLLSLIQAQGQSVDGNRARSLLARFYLGKNRPGDARKLVEEALQIDAANGDALLLRGQFALSDGRLEDAIADYRRVLLTRPADIQALKLLAAAHVHNDDPILAQENMAKVVALSPQDITARQDLVELSLRTGRISDTAAHINALLSVDQQDPKALQFLFKYSILQKQWDKAQQVAERIGQQGDNKATGLYLSGLAYQAAGKLDQSVTALEKSLTLKPDAVEPLTQLIKIYLAQDKAKHAIRFLKNTTQSQPLHFIAFNLLGELYLQAKQTREAEKAFKQAATIKPEWSTPYLNRVRTVLLDGKKNEAKKILQNGIAKLPQAMDLINNLILLHHQDGEHQQVLQLYKAIYEANKPSMLAVNNYASYLANFGNDQKALTEAAQIAQPLESTAQPEFLGTAGWIAYRLQQYTKALGLLEQAQKQGGHSPLLHYHLGLAYSSAGDQQRAREFLQQAIGSEQAFVGRADAIARLDALPLN